MDLENKIKKAKEAGYSDEEINSFLQKKGGKNDLSGYKATTRDVSNLFKSIGLGAVPTILGAGYEGIRAGKQAITGKNQYVDERGNPVENPFLSYMEMGKIKEKPVEQVARQTAGLASYGIPFGGNIPRMALQGAGRFVALKASQPDTTLEDILKAGATGAVTEPAVGSLLKALPFLTKKGVAGKAQEAVTKATEEGKSLTYDQLSDKIRNAVKEKLGYPTEVRDAVNSLISEKAPASIEPGAGPFTPQNMLDWRRQILARQGSGIFKFLQKGGDIQGKVDSIARNVISENLHKLAPEAKIPDYLYSLYSKGGPLIRGDVPTKLLKIGAAATVGRQLPYMLRNILSGALQQAQ